MGHGEVFLTQRPVTGTEATLPVDSRAGSEALESYMIIEEVIEEAADDV